MVANNVAPRLVARAMCGRQSAAAWPEWGRRRQAQARRRVDVEVGAVSRDRPDRSGCPREQRNVIRERGHRKVDVSSRHDLVVARRHSGRSRPAA